MNMMDKRKFRRKYKGLTEADEVLEIQRLAEEKAKKDAAEQLAQQEAAAQERLAAQQRAAERQREAEQRAEELARAEQEKRIKEKALAEQKARRVAEERRLAKEKAQAIQEQRAQERAEAERQRLAEEQAKEIRRAEREKIAAEKKAEQEQRAAEQKKAEIEAQRQAQIEEQRKIEEAAKLAEEKRQADQRAAERAQEEAERRAEAEKRAKAREDARLAEQKRLEQERQEAEQEMQRRAEEERREAELKAQRDAEERAVAERDAEEKRLAEAQAREIQRIAKEKAEAARQAELAANPPTPWERLGEFSVNAAHLARHRVITAEREDPAYTAFDVLRTRLLQALSDNGWSRVAITSPTKDCGKTFTAANLAISLSRQENCRTLLLDCDMRRPSLHRVMGVNNPGAMGDMLRGKTDPSQHLVRLGDNGIHAGRNIAYGFNSIVEPYASELLQDPRTGQTLDRIEEELEPEVMLFDLPPALYYDDVIAFRPMFDGVLLVVGGGTTTEKEIKEVERRLGESTPLLGMILNKAEQTEINRYQY